MTRADRNLIPNFSRDTRLLFEPQIQHPVSLVQNQVGYPGERTALALDQVNQSPGRRDADLGASLEFPELLQFARAAVGARGSEAVELRELAGLEMDLRMFGEIRFGFGRI